MRLCIIKEPCLIILCFNVVLCIEKFLEAILSKYRLSI